MTTATKYRTVTMSHLFPSMKETSKSAKCATCGECIWCAVLMWREGVYRAKLKCGECKAVEWCEVK